MRPGTLNALNFLRISARPHSEPKLLYYFFYSNYNELSLTLLRKI